jgi:hypothetical protein
MEPGSVVTFARPLALLKLDIFWTLTETPFVALPMELTVAAKVSSAELLLKSSPPAMTNGVVETTLVTSGVPVILNEVPSVSAPM